MSTNDVPGAVAAHGDKLGTGCWAEDEAGDGSYILVESTENGQVVYEVFDTTVTPVQAYRGVMSEDQFKKQFSWNSKDPKSIKWTWHDKQPFSFQAIIAKGLQPGSRAAMATDILAEADAIRESADRLGIDLGAGADDAGTAAARVAAHLGLRARALDPEETGRFRRSLGHIRDGIQKAMDEWLV
jgi:hypothetical protein